MNIIVQYDYLNVNKTAKIRYTDIIDFKLHYKDDLSLLEGIEVCKVEFKDREVHTTNLREIDKFIDSCKELRSLNSTAHKLYFETV